MQSWRIRSSLPWNGLWELLEMWAEGSLGGFAVSLPCAVDWVWEFFGICGGPPCPATS